MRAEYLLDDSDGTTGIGSVRLTCGQRIVRDSTSVNTVSVL
jgi:hypothetical protein